MNAQRSRNRSVTVAALAAAMLVALVAAPVAVSATAADAPEDATAPQLLDGAQDLTGGTIANDTTTGTETDVTVDGDASLDANGTDALPVGSTDGGTLDGGDADGTLDGDANATGTPDADDLLANDAPGANGTDAGNDTTDVGTAPTTDPNEPNANVTDRVNDTLPENETDAVAAATAVQSDLSITAGTVTGIDGDVRVGAGTDGPLNLSANVSARLPVVGSVDAAIDLDVGGEGTLNGTNRTGAGGANAGSDGDENGGSGDGLPSPEEAGAGAAIGTALVGGGLLGRRFFEVSAMTGGSGGGGSLLSTATALLRTWGWRVLGLAGYHRLSDSEPLDHETRAEIYERIDDEPGVFLTELSERTDVPMSTLRYHLRVLEYEELIRSEKVRGKRRYVPADVDPDALGSALAEDATAAVLEAVAEEPDSVSGLAERLDRDPSTVTHHLQRLDDDGLVERERDGRSVVTRLADSVDPTEVQAATASGAD